MRFLENLVADLIRDATGINARRMVRRIGGRRLLLGGLAAAGAAALASRQGSQAAASGTGPAAAPGSSGAPAGGGGGYAFTKGEAAPAPAATPPAPPPPVAPPPAASAVPPPPPPAAGSAAAPHPGPPASTPPAPVPPAPVAGPAISPPAEASGDELPAYLAYPAVRTMVAAALADGRLAPEEKASIQARLGESGLDEDQVAQVHQDLVLPPTVEELAVLVSADEDRETLYQLAALVLQSDERVTDLERVWLGRLGAALGLAEERRRVLQDEVFAPGGDGEPGA